MTRGKVSSTPPLEHEGSIPGGIRYMCDTTPELLIGAFCFAVGGYRPTTYPRAAAAKLRGPERSKFQAAYFHARSSMSWTVS